jgi:hypothetical protein
MKQKSQVRLRRIRGPAIVLLNGGMVQTEFSDPGGPEKTGVQTWGAETVGSLDPQPYSLSLLTLSSFVYLFGQHFTMKVNFKSLL